MERSLGRQTLMARVRSWCARVWRTFAYSIGDPVDRLVGPPPWDENGNAPPRIMRS